MKKLILCIITVLVLLSIFLVVRPSSKIDNRLLLADELMKKYPDSAFAFLDTLDSKTFTGENKALFALLMTQAKFKMRNPDSSDSLINIALHYYIYSSDSLRKAQTYFYKGRIDELMGNTKEALLNYQKASEIANTINNNNLLLLTYNKWGLLLQNQSLYEDALEKRKQALKYATINNDTTSQIFILRNIANVYFLKRDFGKALIYYNKALQMAELTKDQNLISTLYNNFAVLYKEIGKHNLAMDYVNKSIPITKPRSITYRFSTKGDLFTRIGNYDSAKYYLNRSLKKDELESKAVHSYLMGELENKFGNFEKAYQYCSQFVKYADTINIKKNKEQIAELQKKYDYSIFKNKNSQLEASKQRFYTLFLSACIAILIIVGSFLFYISKKNREREEMKKAKDDFIKQTMWEVKSKTIELQKLQEEMWIKERDQQLHLSQKEEELKLRRQKEQELKIRILKMDAIVNKINSLQSLTTIQRIKSAEIKLSAEELANLEEVVEVCFDDFASRLRKKFSKLKDDDIYLCCLLKMKVTNRDMISLLNTNELALKKRKYRMKYDKMELPEESNLDEFILNF